MTVQEQKVNELSDYELDLAYRKKLLQLYRQDLDQILLDVYLNDDRMKDIDQFTDYDCERIIRAFESYKSLYTADFDNWLEAIDNYIDYKIEKKRKE